MKIKSVSGMLKAMAEGLVRERPDAVVRYFIDWAGVCADLPGREELRCLGGEWESVQPHLKSLDRVDRVDMAVEFKCNGRVARTEELRISGQLLISYDERAVTHVVERMRRWMERFEKGSEKIEG